jgi:hypothetical protein
MLDSYWKSGKLSLCIGHSRLKLFEIQINFAKEADAKNTEIPAIF